MIHLFSLQETKKIYLELLANYKTPASKKAFLTKELRKQREWIADVSEAINREGTSKHWLLGDMYFNWHLNHYKKELSLIEKLRSEI